MISALSAIFKFWLPASDFIKEYDQVKIKLFIKVIVVICLVGMISSFLTFLLSEEGKLKMYFLLSTIACILLALIVLGLVKKTGNIHLSFNFGAFLGLLVLGLPVYEAGGLYSSQILWVLVFPVAAFFIVSKRAGILWTGIAILFVTFYFMIDFFDIKKSLNHLDSTSRRFFDLSFLTLYVCFVLYMYERNIKKLLDKMEQAQNELHQQNLSLTELNRVKETLMAIVAHDLRTPHNQLWIILKMMEEELGDKKLKADYIGMGKRILQNSLFLINDITYSKEISSGKFLMKKESIKVDEFAEEVVETFKASAQEKNIFIVSEIETVKTKLLVDKSILNRILQNLISNAIKFSPFDKKVYFSLRKDNNKLIFSVKDEGPGIDKEEQKIIFRRFQKLSPRPTNQENSNGLGLYIVKILSDKAGGELKVLSEVGKGSEFQFILPVK